MGLIKVSLLKNKPHFEQLSRFEMVEPRLYFGSIHRKLLLMQKKNASFAVKKSNESNNGASSEEHKSQLLASSHNAPYIYCPGVLEMEDGIFIFSLIAYIFNS